MNRGNVSVLSAGAYSATLFVIVTIVNRVGRAPPPSPLSPARADFTIMIDCTPEIGHFRSVCTLWLKPHNFPCTSQNPAIK